MKICNTCRESKPLDEFGVVARFKSGYDARCKKCNNELQRARYAARDKIKYSEKQAERMKTYWMKVRYGLTPTQHKGLMANGCAVCGSMNDLCVDHDHKCCPGYVVCGGKCIRGALCGKHNRALGNANDSVDELMALAAYLLQFENVLDRATTLV